MAEETTNTATGDLGENQGEGTGGSPTTQPGTLEGEGQAAAAGTGTTEGGTQQTATESFFNPQTELETADLEAIRADPNLAAAYKQMQRAFGSKMEGIKGSQTKIDAFDAMNADPIASLQSYAKQYGYNLTRADAAAAVQDATQTEPGSWDEVNNRAVDAVLEKLQPIIAGLQTQNTELRKTNMERVLDDSAPDWRQYEDKMTANLREHPTLANDPSALYRMSVPPEVLESRATQAALKKLQDKTAGSQTSGVSTTRATDTGEPSGPVTFNQAVEIAKKKMAEEGITQ